MRTPLLILHIFGGIAGMLSGAAAMIFKKGSGLHILAGRVFVGAMLTMGAVGAFLAFLKHEPDNVGGGLFTFYLVLTAWLTARRADGQTSKVDWAIILIPLTLGILSWAGGLKTLRSGASSQNDVPVGMTFFMGSVMLLAAAGDLRMLLNGGVSGATRIGRHLWRMCFGLFIAAGSFFFGGNNRPLRLLSSIGIARYLPSPFFSMNVYVVLTVLPLVLLMFWALRVRFTNRWRTAFGKAREGVA